jgi:hypothetical protein
MLDDWDWVSQSVTKSYSARVKRSHFAFCAGIVSVVLIWGAASTAYAQELRVARLLYDRTENAFACPSSEELASAIDARLGRSAIVSNASLVLTVHVELGADAKLSALVRMWDGAATIGERRLEGYDFDCRALIDSLVLASSIAIDPDFVDSPTPQPNASPSASPSPVPTPVAPSPEPTPLTAELALAPTVMRGGPPETSYGINIDASLTRPTYAFGLVLRAQFPGSTIVSAGQGRVEATLLLAGVSLCGRVSVLRLCGRADVGSLRASASGLPSSRTVTDVYADVGVRIAVDIPLFDRLSLEPWVEGTVAVARTNYLVGEQVAYSPEPVAFVGGLALVVRLGDLSIL